MRAIKVARSSKVMRSISSIRVINKTHIIASLGLSTLFLLGSVRFGAATFAAESFSQHQTASERHTKVTRKTNLAQMNSRQLLSTQTNSEKQNESEHSMTAKEETEAVAKAMTEALKELLQEYYSKIKISQDGNKIHFEYKVRRLAGVGGKETIVPELGGIMGDLKIVDGEYAGKTRLPQQFNEHAQYSVILMAPYSAKHDCHLYTRLSYPYDVVPEFLERFKEVANKFDETAEGVATIKPQRAVATTDDTRAGRAETMPGSGGSTIESTISAGKTTGESARASTVSTAGASTGSAESVSRTGSATGSATASATGSAKASGTGSATNSETGSTAGTPAGSANGAADGAATDTRSSARSQTTTGTASGSSNASAKLKLIMWKLKKGSQTIYMLGTIPYHAEGKSFLPLSPEIEIALNESKQLLVDSIDIKKTLPGTDTRIYGSTDKKLSTLLSAPTREVLDKYLAWSGDSLEMYDLFKPWFASVALDHSVMRKAGFHPTKLKEHLMDKAKRASKPVVELESAETKVKVLDGLSTDVQDRMLRNSVYSLMNYQDEQTRLEGAWRAGDEIAVHELSLLPAKNDTGLVGIFEDVMTEQNLELASRIVNLSKSSSPLFVAMDARRIVGESGLVALLKRDGYSSEQLTGSSANQRIAGAVSLDEEPDFGATRLQRYTYPEGKFSILLPGKPAMNFSNVDGQRRVDYTYKDPQGAMFVGYIITPGVVPRAALPTVLFKIATSLSQKYGAKETKQYTITVAGHPGRQLDFTSVQGQVGKDIKLRLVVAGSFVYIIGAEGTPPWVKSPGVKQFFDSLIIAPAAGERASSPFGFGQTPGTQALNQQFIDLLRKQQESVGRATGEQQTFPSQQRQTRPNYSRNRPWGVPRPSTSKPWR